MGNSEFAIKFSNEMYATKQEVIEKMRTPLIDNIWNDILEYRKSYSQIIDLKHINGTRFNICFTPLINQKISECERKLNKLTINYSKLKASDLDVSFNNLEYKETLNELAKKYNLTNDAQLIEPLISKKLSVLPPNLMILNRYLNCLSYIQNNYSQKISDLYLGEFYSYLTGNEELNEFYRTVDVDNEYSKVLINRLYIGIPHKLIANSMGDLFDFIEFSQVSLIVKAAVSLYYFYYIQPFAYFSEELAILLFKSILAHNDLENIGALINVESLLNCKEEFEKWLLESQKTFDLTYFVLYIVNKVSEICDRSLDNIVLTQKNAVVNEVYSSDTVIKANTSIKVENKKEEVKEVIKEVKIEEPIEKKEVIVESNEAKQETDTLVNETLDNKKTIKFSDDIAIGNIPTKLSDEEAKYLAERLVEINPAINRKQAIFYSRHCTLGMSYTINQFQKEIGCAYETARTSMDHLVELGFYRKEMYKKKFIYLPVKRK